MNKVFLCFCFFSNSCGINASHSLPIKGTLVLKENSDKEICIKIKHDSLTLGEKPYKGLKGIKDIYIRVSEVYGSNYWRANHKYKNKIIFSNESFCINSSNFDSKLSFQGFLVENSYYSISLKGYSSNNKYRIHLVKQFYYNPE